MDVNNELAMRTILGMAATALAIAGLVGCVSDNDAGGGPASVNSSSSGAAGSSGVAGQQSDLAQQQLAEAAKLEREWGFAGLGANSGQSGPGEFCAWTNDCRADLDLVCVGQSCVPRGYSDADSGTRTLIQPERRLGLVGESCTHHADCDPQLVCVAGACVPPSSLTVVEQDGGVSTGVGSSGESCEARSDCRQGLACVDGVCTAPSAGLSPTDNECVVVECKEAVDCCPAVSDNCPQLRAACDEAEPTSLICSRYAATCQCDGSNYSCDRGQCELMFTCSDLVLCPGLLVCDSGNCVRCVSDNDCLGNAKCSDNECAQACDVDSDCPYFNQCLEGACIDVGCQTDRECKAFLNNPQALCQDGDCFSVCSTDINCGAAEGSNMVCMNGTCVPAGCETDEECRVQLYRTHQEDQGTTAPTLPVNPAVMSTEEYAVECRPIAE